MPPKKQMRKGAKFSRPSSKRSKRNTNFRPLRVYNERSDQQITFKSVTPYKVFEHSKGTVGTYFHGYSVINPHYALLNSSYSPLLNVYDLFRVKKIVMKTWIPGASANVGGCTSSKLYRDNRTNEPNPYYEGLLQEREHKRGRAKTTFKWTWFPIEPSDMDYLNTQSAAVERYGQLNIAGIAFPEWSEVLNPVIEYTYYIDFKYLENPKPAKPFYVGESSEEDDEHRENKDNFVLLANAIKQVNLNDNKIVSKDYNRKLFSR